MDIEKMLNRGLVDSLGLMEELVKKTIDSNASTEN